MTFVYLMKSWNCACIINLCICTVLCPIPLDIAFAHYT